MKLMFVDVNRIDEDSATELLNVFRPVDRKRKDVVVIIDPFGGRHHEGDVRIYQEGDYANALVIESDGQYVMLGDCNTMRDHGKFLDILFNSQLIKVRDRKPEDGQEVVIRVRPSKTNPNGGGLLRATYTKQYGNGSFLICTTAVTLSLRASSPELVGWIEVDSVEV